MAITVPGRFLCEVQQLVSVDCILPGVQLVYIVLWTACRTLLFLGGNLHCVVIITSGIRKFLQASSRSFQVSQAVNWQHLLALLTHNSLSAYSLPFRSCPGLSLLSFLWQICTQPPYHSFCHGYVKEMCCFFCLRNVKMTGMFPSFKMFHL